MVSIVYKKASNLGNGLQWRKASRSGVTANCVEVRFDPGGARVDVRDSKNSGGAILSFGRSTFAAFIQDVKNGKLDRSV